MPNKLSALFVFILFTITCGAQKPFIEGFLVYDISIQSPDNNTTVTGTYTITVKGKKIREELRLNNNYHSILIFDDFKETIYSLKEDGNKKYAIQLSMGDFYKSNKHFEDFTLSDNNKEGKKIAGMPTQCKTVTYTDGNTAEIYYTTQWQPTDKWMFERFPGIRYLPLSFTYKDAANLNMSFKAEKIDLAPVESANFTIPHDYKMISYAEYQQMNK